MISFLNAGAMALKDPGSAVRSVAFVQPHLAGERDQQTPGVIVRS